MRLTIPKPAEDETISSILDRACTFYRARRKDLIQELSSTTQAGPVDLDINPPPDLLECLARALRMSPGNLEGRLLARPDWRLLPEARVAYCPSCWDEDIAAGREPYFRGDWSWCFVTICLVHDRPLERWGHQSHSDGQRYFYRIQLVRFPGAGDSSAPTFNNVSKHSDIDWFNSEIHKVWSLVKQHEMQLRKSLGPEPKCHDLRIRWLYCLVVGDWHRRRLGPPLKVFRPSGRSRALLGFRSRHDRHCASESRAGSWNHFRKISYPDHRRTANWLVASLTLPRPHIQRASHLTGVKLSKLRAGLLSGLHERYKDIFVWALASRTTSEKGYDSVAERCVEGCDFRIPTPSEIPNRADEAAAWIKKLSDDLKFKVYD